MAGLAQVPVVVREVTDDRQLLELALVENLQRSELNPIEEALAYQALADEFGHSQEEIAQRVGKARPTIANSLRLLNLHPAAQALVRAGKLTAGQARPLLAVHRPADQVALAERAVREGLSARQLESLAAEPPARRKRPGTPTTDVHSAAAAERLTRRLQTRVEIRRKRRGGGVVHIHFHSEEELMRLFDRLVDGGEV
jgi:ParB family chromosome partitioning protein